MQQYHKELKNQAEVNFYAGYQKGIYAAKKLGVFEKWGINEAEVQAMFPDALREYREGKQKVQNATLSSIHAGGNSAATAPGKSQVRRKDRP